MKTAPQPIIIEQSLLDLLIAFRQTVRAAKVEMTTDAEDLEPEDEQQHWQ